MKVRTTVFTILCAALITFSFFAISCTTDEATSLSVSGMVAPYDHLTLQHNLGTDYISTMILNNGNFAISYQDVNNSMNGTFVIYGKQHLALEMISNNEVRLWNYTKETLEMMLSVNLQHTMEMLY